MTLIKSIKWVVTILIVLALVVADVYLEPRPFELPVKSILIVLFGAVGGMAITMMWLGGREEHFAIMFCKIVLIPFGLILALWQISTVQAADKYREMARYYSSPFENQRVAIGPWTPGFFDVIYYVDSPGGELSTEVESERSTATCHVTVEGGSISERLKADRGFILSLALQEECKLTLDNFERGSLPDPAPFLQARLFTKGLRGTTNSFDVSPR